MKAYKKYMTFMKNQFLVPIKNMFFFFLKIVFSLFSLKSVVGTIYFVLN